ncbi:MAG TPA: Rne/Rng family ribonuclease [Candidatus Acidoferrum sp.]|nr:Rne/Rng family ribonuclease [Candidatus Acidoferrum sp.]
MSKELVISAASHERRVAILEEGQLVEIYIEREKEFALVGSIYKGKVTRVLPGMQSAFVDIGLDGDAFLYVSDVFENLEEYDPGHPHEQPQRFAPALPPAIGSPVEVLPGESLARASEHHADSQHQEFHPEESHVHDSEHAGVASIEDHVSHDERHAAPEHFEEHQEDLQPAARDELRAEHAEERQPDSNASAPQNFSPHYNPTQNYPARTGNDRSGQNFGRSQDRGGDRGNDRGRGSRWGRRGGRRRGGRPQGGPAGRNLPPSKYAPPQGGESRGYDNRGGQPRSYDNRRPETPRGSAPPPVDAAEETILLPGESLAKYRGKPIAAASPAALEEQEVRSELPEAHENSSRATGNTTAAAPGGGVPRRFSGGLPRWLLADAGTEAEAPPEEALAVEVSAANNAVRESEPVRNEAELNEDQVAALAADFVEAKHEEATAEAEADALVGGAVFEEEDSEEESSEADEPHAEEVSELSDEETEEVEAGRAANRAEFAADVAQESAEHAAQHGERHEAEQEHAEHDAFEHEPEEHGPGEPLEAEHVHAESEVIASSSSEPIAEAAIIEEDVILLPGETRAPRTGGHGAPREDFPRDSARIGGNPRSRFQRPFRSGGRDRGRDSRGGRPDSRGGRPDRGGRPSGGQRFERRSSGGPRHNRGYQGGHSGPSRRPQLISEMLKAGQDIVIQIAKEPLGKKGARITSHVALPGRFLVYMPTVHHTGVSRKIISAENRSRLRRLVSEAGNSYPGGFIVRTAAGDATDEEIRSDIEFLGKTWNEIKEKSEERKAPALLHRDLDLVERMLRDYVSDDFTAIWIDSEEEYGKVVEFVSRFQPKLVNRVKLYTKETPIFEEFGIQHELDKALRAKVWLKSGGYIVINHTEALVAIDVNTGKFVGKGSTRLEDTIVKTNLEAVKEIVRQIRLRDLGGIIVVDFIDMEERRNREKVLSALQMALEQDKAPSKALSFNEFGLVCITRKRTKQALERVLCQPCPYCTGSGMVKSIPTLCYEIQAEARKMAAAADADNPNLTLRVHPEIAKALKTRESMLIDELEQNSHKHVIIQSDATLHWEQYDIY